MMMRLHGVQTREQDGMAPYFPEPFRASRSGLNFATLIVCVNCGSLELASCMHALRRATKRPPSHLTPTCNSRGDDDCPNRYINVKQAPRLPPTHTVRKPTPLRSNHADCPNEDTVLHTLSGSHSPALQGAETPCEPAHHEQPP